MNVNGVAFAVLFSTISLAVAAAEGTGVEALLERTRSHDQKERAAAVSELLSQREAIALGLTRIVSQANNGSLGTESKAIALSLMGELGLLQCRNVLDAERDWKRVVEDIDEIVWLNYHEGRRMERVIGFPARFALMRAAFEPIGAAELVRQRKSGNLQEYPRLAAAVSDLASHDRQERRRGEGFVLQWYRSVCEAMNEALSPVHMQPVEIRSTAAYVLGEFRTLDSTMLLWSIELADQDGVCDEYPAAISVRTDSPKNPSVVALLKLGGRLNIDQALTQIETKDLSGNARYLLLQTLLTVDAETTRRLYHARAEFLAAAVRKYPSAEVDRRQAEAPVEEKPPAFPGSLAEKERKAARAAAELPLARLQTRARLNRLLAVKSLVEEGSMGDAPQTRD